MYVNQNKMDVGELLTYQPDKPLKRKREENGQTEKRPGTKIRDRGIRREGGPAVLASGSGERGLSKEEKDRILKMVEEEPEDEGLDETSLRRVLLSFEKKVYRNQEMRIKFPDQAEKFMESEINLNDVIQEMHVIATVPELYHHIVDLNAVQSLLGLLTHDNTDISVATVDLLQELTDVDTLSESEDGATALIDALLDNQVVATLVQNMDRLDEGVKEEADGIHNSLGIIENILEFRPEVAPEAAKQGLMQWLLKRIKTKMPFDANKLYSSEILAILLQNHDENRELLGELDGIDTLLQQLAAFKRHDPSSNEEFEMMENLFNCLCSALMFMSNRAKFLQGEGLQLMNLMLREKKLSRNSALKVLDHAMSGNEGTDNCIKFIEILGLRTVFPLFMKTPKKTKQGPSEEEHEEHAASVIASLIRNCDGAHRQRLMGKFTENDHAKVDRLMELHFKYLDKVQHCDDQIEREKQKIRRSGEEITDDMEDEFYLRRLDVGLFTLQLVDYIMIESCNAGIPSIKQRIIQILNLRGGSITAIRNVVREYAGNIGDAKSKDSAEVEKQRLLALVDKF
ncbi:beta-catenin-like protein 1 [Glandiceps talaboti]